MKRLAIFFNGAYSEKPANYPRQIKRLDKFHDTLHKYKLRGDFIPVYFEGATVDDIHRNLSTQIREQLRHVISHRKVIFGGDGFIGSVLNSAGKVRDEWREKSPEMADEIDHHPFMIAKGGSLNLLSKRLGSDNLQALTEFGMGVEVNRVEARRRIMKITALDGKTSDAPALNTQTYPFMMFAGTGRDAVFMKMLESQARTRHYGFNILKSGSRTIAEVIMDNNGYDQRAIMTIPYFGLTKLPDTHDTLSEKAFYTTVHEIDSSLEAVGVALISQFGLGVHKHLTRTVLALQNKFSYYKINNIQNEVIKPNCSEGLCFYTDGFPQVFPLTKNQVAKYSVDTLDSPGVFLASFQERDEK